MFRAVYFAAATAWGYILLKDSPNLYPSIGGPPDGTMARMEIKSIFMPYTEEMLDYSLWTFGFHFGMFIDHTFLEERHNDFAEMFLHHVAAVCLYFAYIYGGIIPFGSVVAYLHDIADVPTSLTKSLSATKLELATVVVGICLLISWFWTRLYLLPQIIYIVITQAEYPPEFAHFTPFLWFNVIFLSIMGTLHYYWYVLILNAFRKAIVTGKADDD